MDVVDLGWAHQVQQSETIPNLPVPHPAKLRAGCRQEWAPSLHSQQKTPDSASGLGFQVWFWDSWGWAGRLLSSCQCLGTGACVPLRCATGRSQSQAAWGHLGKGLRLTLSILPRDRAEILLSHPVALLSVLPAPVPAVLPLISRAKHAWQGLFGSSEVLLSWILGKILSWKEWSGPGRWQSHHPRAEHMWPLLGFGWRLDLKILGPFPTLVIHDSAQTSSASYFFHHLLFSF